MLQSDGGGFDGNATTRDPDGEEGGEGDLENAGLTEADLHKRLVSSEQIEVTLPSAAKPSWHRFESIR